MVMLLTENKDYEKLMDNKDWVAEFKRDGNFLKVVMNKYHGKVITELYNRKGELYTKDIPDCIYESFKRFEKDDYCQSATLMGELVYVSKDGKDHRTQSQSPNAKPYFMAFDITELNNEDLRNRPWKERKHELTQLFFIYDMQPKTGSSVILVPHHLDKRGVLEVAETLGLEGIVLKNVNGLYVSGRSNDNIKVKFTMSDEYIVIGYVIADEFSKNSKGETINNKRFPYFGALILAKYDNENNLIPMGRVGGGFTDKDLEEVTVLLDREINDGNDTYYVNNATNNKDNYPKLTDKDYRYPKNKINWLDVNDWFVIEIKMSMLTEYGKPFQPRFVSLRDDKKPSDCVVIE